MHVKGVSISSGKYQSCSLIYHKYINNCLEGQDSVVYDLLVTENHCTSRIGIHVVTATIQHDTTNSKMA